MESKDNLGLFCVSEAVVMDIPDLALYLSTNTTGYVSFEDWLLILHWMWPENPFFSTNDLLGWKIIDQNNTIVGFIGAIPVVYGYNNYTFKGYWGTSWYVNEEARSLSLDLFNNFSRLNGLLINNTPVEKVERLISKVYKFRKSSNNWFQSSTLFSLNPINNKGWNKSSLKQLISNYIVKLVLLSVWYFRALLFEIVKLWFRDGDAIKVEIANSSSNLNHVPSPTFGIDKSERFYKWICFNERFRTDFKVLTVDINIERVGIFIFKKRKTAKGVLWECVDESLDKLKFKKRVLIYIKLINKINKENLEADFVILRSHLNISYLRFLLGFRINRAEKCYYKFPKIDEEAKTRSFLPGSLDGDNIFF